MTETPAYRYAIYYAPKAESDWWKRGSAWLGRCAASNTAQVQPKIDGVPAQTLHSLTAEPRRYGWHATLKAPFQLVPECSFHDLSDALAGLASRFVGFELPALQPVQLHQFLALVPESDCSALHDIAAACVVDLHHLAAPLSPKDLQRKRLAPLTPLQDHYLEQWAYPYVLDAFRFHCSLTGSLQDLTPQTVQALKNAAALQFQGLTAPRLDSFALFAEPVRGANFQLVRHFSLQPCPAR